jgi:hypothetical protein
MQPTQPKQIDTFAPQEEKGQEESDSGRNVSGSSSGALSKTSGRMPDLKDASVSDISVPYLEQTAASPGMSIQPTGLPNRKESVRPSPSFIRYIEPSLVKNRDFIDTLPEEEQKLVINSINEVRKHRINLIGLSRKLCALGISSRKQISSGTQKEYSKKQRNLRG